MPSVLIVDDEPGLLNLFSSLVRRLNCRTLLAESGQIALEILDLEIPDLLILDLAMPEMSGKDVLRYVRSVPRLSGMKVMILTARPNMVPDVVPLGIDSWVPKPVAPREFQDAVLQVLSS